MNQSALAKTGLQQIEAVLNKWNEIKQHNSRYDDTIGQYTSIDNAQAQEIINLMMSAINRVAPSGSHYRQNADAAIELYRKTGQNYHAEVSERLSGILLALQFDYSAGYLQTIQELVHADVFSDFLEMADYFYQQGYKDPAAVMAGSVLEEHLRKLCIKNGIDIEEKKPNGNVPKTAGRLNDDLAGQNVYSKLDQKSATAWIDLRNKAAHGKYNEYTKEQVALMVQGIRDFLVRYSA